MSQLVEQLKAEHKWLVEKLTEVRMNSHSPEALKSLDQARKGLLAHLKKEDEKLYPVLKRAAATDQKAREVYDLFGNEMKTISAAALAFFEKYPPTRTSAGPEFTKDLDGLVKVLGGRISSEELTLYATYDRVAAQFGEEPDMPAHLAAQAPRASAAYWVGGVAALAAISAAIIKFF